MASTALANATSLHLQEPVDWVSGDHIVIAPTGKDGNETEVKSDVPAMTASFKVFSTDTGERSSFSFS